MSFAGNAHGADQWRDRKGCDIDGARSAALLAGVAADAVLGDPRRWHPVAGFGHLAIAAERANYADSRMRGLLHCVVLVGGAVLMGSALERSVRERPWRRATLIAAGTWVAVGGASLSREATALAASLGDGDLLAARARLPSLCGRDPRELPAGELARAAVESVAENTSDAVVAPLFWGAIAGLPGLLGYRAINTLDAMVGHRNARYRRFGWASARADDVANWIPARVTAALFCLLAPAVGGRSVEAARILRRFGAAHPSPNAGRCEASMAGALGVRLGGANRYGSRIERRPVLGEGRAPHGADIVRAVRLSRVTTVAAAVVVATAALAARRCAAVAAGPVRRPAARGRSPRWAGA